jgi:hypothetical protein
MSVEAQLIEMLTASDQVADLHILGRVFDSFLFIALK